MICLLLSLRLFPRIEGGAISTIHVTPEDGFSYASFEAEIKLEWGKWLAQKREAEARLQELEVEKDIPFARTRLFPRIEGGAISTIHVTPEDGFSYASFEAVGYDFKQVDLSGLVERVLACFGLAKFSMALHCSSATVKEVDSSVYDLDLTGYTRRERCNERFGNGGATHYSSFISARGCGSPPVDSAIMEQRERG